MANALMVKDLKRCNRCRIYKPLDAFSKHETTKDRRRTYCKMCSVKMAQNYKKRNPLWQLEYRLKSKYGISLEEYNTILARQNNCCAICYIEFSKSKNGKICVDHNHQTNQIRGLLCFNCNIVLGHANDKVDVLQQAIRYLGGDCHR